MPLASTDDLAGLCRPVELLVLDVDGVLTDGSIVVDDRGVESKHFHVRDGAGIALWRKAGRRVAIISGRSARCVEVRAEELGIAPVIQGSGDKRIPILALIKELGLDRSQVCAIGDDLADLRMFDEAGLSACPSDAAPEVVEAAHLVADRPGGRGAVREIIEAILRHQGRWEGLVDGFRAGP